MQQIRVVIGGLEATLEMLRATAGLRCVQAVEEDLRQWRRRERELMRETPAVADTFLRLRKAEAQEFQAKKLVEMQMKQRRADALKCIADRDAAVAETNRTRRKLQELESARVCKHACKTFTLECLGAGTNNAGGPKAKKNRFEVLDRLSRLRQGLSDAQKNDFPWWKEAWDAAMVAEHGAVWAATFGSWV